MIIEKVSESTRTSRMKTYTVQCDFCPEVSRKTAQEPGDAAERARDIGWTTKVGVLGDPLKWVCPKCRNAS